MLKWIFWLIILWWLLSKLMADTKKNNATNEYNTDDKSSFKPNHSDIKNKHLKNDAGDYVDYEEIN